MMKQRMILLLTAFGIRLAVGWWLGHFHHPRIWEYEEIANHLLAGQGYFYEHLGTPYRAFMAPLYPLVYASVCAVTNHTHSILVILHCALSAFATLQVYAIGMLIFKNPSIAQLGAWLVAFHPGLILYASRLHILNADVFAFLWVLWAWLGLFQSSSWTKAIQVGFASGFAILIRGTIILFLLFAMIVFLWSTPVFQRIKALKLVGLSALIITICVAPWLVRNTILFHRFPVFITSSGWVFWTGNNPYATGSYSLPDGRAVLTATPESFQEQLTQLDELGQARLFSQEAWRYIRAHPFRTLWLDMKKFYSFWWFSPFTGKGYYPMAYLHWYRWYYGLISALALVYLWINRRRLWEIPFVVLLGYALSIATFQSFYYVEGRNRWTVEPVLLLLAAGGTLCVRDRLRTRMAVIG